MDKQEYHKLCEVAGEFTPLPGECWNRVYQQRLFACGLMLTEKFPTAAPWMINAPHADQDEPYSWPKASYIVPVPDFAPPVENESELRDTLRLFRDFYIFYVTQTKMGASHHHPIWSRIAHQLGEDNNRKVSEEEYHFITAPFWETQKNEERT